MGRTLQTTNQLILQEIANFNNFRRALRAEDQKLFDALFAAARLHTAAISMADHALPFESVLLAILIEQQRHIEQLKTQLNGR
jgi:integral membrane sensor domain MASE1